MQPLPWTMSMSEHLRNRVDLVISSRAATRLSAARHWVRSLSRHVDALILGPHRHATEELARGEVASSGSWFGLERFTIERLAIRLAAPSLAREGITLCPPLSLVAVASRATH